jgi:ribonuclease T1
VFLLRALLPLLVVLWVGDAAADFSQPRAMGTILLAELPSEARDTLALVKRGGPYPYRKDGSVFGNFERRLPAQPRGYYREYTVPTPGARDRGARRIVAGQGARADVRSAGEYYYTDDHYRSFRKIIE